MDLSSMKEGTKATPSYCYWSPATEQAQETEMKPKSKAGARRRVTIQSVPGKMLLALAGW
jgi:hypothetical protein